MDGKKAGCSGAMNWVGWSCLMGGWERVGEGAGLLLTGVNQLHSCSTRGAAEEVDARISSPFSEIKLPALSS